MNNTIQVKALIDYYKSELQALRDEFDSYKFNNDQEIQTIKETIATIGEHMQELAETFYECTELINDAIKDLNV